MHNVLKIFGIVTYLTLTSVVFEYDGITTVTGSLKDLTLTSVVFECR